MTLLLATTFTVAGALVGATLGAYVAWANSVRQTKNDNAKAEAQLAEQRRLALTARASDFLAATQHAVLSMRNMAQAAPVDKLLLEKSEVWPTIDRTNSCLVAIEINDDESLVIAAKNVDHALVDLARDAKAQQFDRQAWSDHRNARIGTLPADFKKLARDLALKLQTGKIS